MEEHYRKYHGEMSAKLKGEVALAVHEREDTLQLRKVKPTSDSCQGCSCAGPKAPRAGNAAGKKRVGR
jgi:hypothetical protein